ncbi:MAG TPA: TIM barrel protein, partial [Planctomycetota bacterium]|nr:TIM barrel protein [Planctomycetota bacterium]
VRPELYNWVVASFNSPWVKAYFDVGNHVKYAGILRGDKVEIAYLPEVWIRTFGPRLAKIHVKDYKLNPDGKGGNWAGIGQGSVNWPEVRKALDEVGYNGWLTDETGLGWPELNKRLDRIIAGEQPVPPTK